MTREEFIKTIGTPKALELLKIMESKKKYQCWNPGLPGKLVWYVETPHYLQHIEQTVTAVAFADTPYGEFNDYNII